MTKFEKDSAISWKSTGSFFKGRSNSTYLLLLLLLLLLLSSVFVQRRASLQRLSLLWCGYELPEGKFGAPRGPVPVPYRIRAAGAGQLRVREQSRASHSPCPLSLYLALVSERGDSIAASSSVIILRGTPESWPSPFIRRKKKKISI